MYKHVLIPTDGSELSDKAIKNGVAFAKAVGAKVTGLHVIPALIPTYYGEAAWLPPNMEVQVRDSARKQGNKYLDRIEATAQAAGVAFERALLENDQPWKAIIDTAQAKHCDVIAMAAHGRRGIAAMLIGSETNKVLTHTRIPVLVYR